MWNAKTRSATGTSARQFIASRPEQPLYNRPRAIYRAPSDPTNNLEKIIRKRAWGGVMGLATNYNFNKIAREIKLMYPSLVAKFNNKNMARRLNYGGLNSATHQRAKEILRRLKNSNALPMVKANKVSQRANVLPMVKANTVLVNKVSQRANTFVNSRRRQMAARRAAALQRRTRGPL